MQTIQEWVRNGMPRVSVGAYLKPWLDLYLRTDGMPSELDKQALYDQYPELEGTAPGQTDTLAETSNRPDLTEEGDFDDFELPDDLDPELLDALEGLELSK